METQKYIYQYLGLLLFCSLGGKRNITTVYKQLASSLRRVSQRAVKVNKNQEETIERQRRARRVKALLN